MAKILAKIQKEYRLSFWCNQCCSKSLSELLSLQKEAEWWMHLQWVRNKCFYCTFKVCSTCKFPLEAQSVFGAQNYHPAEDESCSSAFCTIATSWKSWRRKKGGKKPPKTQKLDTQIGEMIKEDHWGGK